MSAPSMQWYWKDDKQWVAYDAETNRHLNEARQHGTKVLDIHLSGRHYHIKLKEMKQKNLKTKFCRKIKCEQVLTQAPNPANAQQLQQKMYNQSQPQGAPATHQRRPPPRPQRAASYHPGPQQHPQYPPQQWPQNHNGRPVAHNTLQGGYHPAQRNPNFNTYNANPANYQQPPPRPQYPPQHQPAVQYQQPRIHQKAASENWTNNTRRRSQTMTNTYKHDPFNILAPSQTRPAQPPVPSDASHSQSPVAPLQRHNTFSVANDTKKRKKKKLPPIPNRATKPAPTVTQPVQQTASSSTLRQGGEQHYHTPSVPTIPEGSVSSQTPHQNGTAPYVEHQRPAPAPPVNNIAQRPASNQSNWQSYLATHSPTLLHTAHASTNTGRRPIAVSTDLPAKSSKPSKQTKQTKKSKRPTSVKKERRKSYPSHTLTTLLQSAMHTAIPDFWAPQEKNCVLVSVDKASREFAKVTASVVDTLPSATVTKVERVQNIWLWQRYVRERSTVVLKNNGEVSELLLFHGTKTTKPSEIHNGEYGFDIRFARQGLWGTGLYFAEKAKYSDRYCHKKGKTRQFFLVQVNVGMTKSCAQDKMRRMPPKMKSKKKNQPQDLMFSTRRYDSVQGYHQGSNIYILYAHDRAYPSYLITYTV